MHQTEVKQGNPQDIIIHITLHGQHFDDKQEHRSVERQEAIFVWKHLDSCRTQTNLDVLVQ